MQEAQKEEWVVERLQPKDVLSMAQLHTTVWIETFTAKDYGIDLLWAQKRMEEKYLAKEIRLIQEATLEDSTTAERVWFVVKDSFGKVIGMARPYRHDEEGLQRVGAIYVDKYYQGKGVADALMKKVIQWSKQDEPLYLWVAKENKRAKRFYERWGV